AQTFRGRGGGLCVEANPAGGSNGIESALDVAFDCSGDWSMLVSWYRAGEDSPADTNYNVASMGNSGKRVVLLERAGPSASGSKNWHLGAANEGTTSTAATLDFTVDPDDFSYNTGWDTLLVRDGTELHHYGWLPGGAVAYHEQAVVG